MAEQLPRHSGGGVRSRSDAYDHEGRLLVFRRGDRVVVMNPGPLSRGTVARDCLAGDHHCAVDWDDGETGRPQTRLLALENEVDDG